MGHRAFFIFWVQRRMIALFRHKHLTARFLVAAMIPRILSALLLLYLTSSSWAQSLDLLIRNGSVLDGSDAQRQGRNGGYGERGVGDQHAKGIF
jgi:cytosine/uracil/thiamine/allantoin permease